MHELISSGIGPSSLLFARFLQEANEKPTKLALMIRIIYYQRMELYLQVKQACEFSKLMWNEPSQVIVIQVPEIRYSISNG